MVRTIVHKWQRNKCELKFDPGIIFNLIIARQQFDFSQTSFLFARAGERALRSSLSALFFRVHLVLGIKLKSKFGPNEKRVKERTRSDRFTGDVSRAEFFLRFVPWPQPILPQDEKVRLNYTSIKIFHVNRAMNFQFPFMHHVRVASIHSLPFLLSLVARSRARASCSAVFRCYLLHVYLISRRRIIIHFLGGNMYTTRQHCTPIYSAM